jgi:hypothetical protein
VFSYFRDFVISEFWEKGAKLARVANPFLQHRGCAGGCR